MFVPNITPVTARTASEVMRRDEREFLKEGEVEVMKDETEREPRRIEERRRETVGGVSVAFRARVTARTCPAALTSETSAPDPETAETVEGRRERTRESGRGEGREAMIVKTENDINLETCSGVGVRGLKPGNNCAREPAS